MQEERFSLIPLGNIREENQKQIIEVAPGYRRGLKKLSLFSHAIIIYRGTAAPNIFGTCLSQRVAALKEVDEKQGRLCVSIQGGLRDTGILYDIKPYFPNEDRVRNATAPSRAEYCDSASLYAEEIKGLGTIRKDQGTFSLEIQEKPDNYLQALQGCSHIRVIWWFHKFEKAVYKRTLECDPPYENAPRTGIFASRSPVRPNPIAITTTRIADVDAVNGRIRVSALDCFDNTPLLGISPYFPELDAVSGCRLPPWLEHWPKWLDDREFSADAVPALAPPATALLKKYYSIPPQPALSGELAPAVPKEQTLAVPSEQTCHCLAGTSESPREDGIVIKGASQNNLKHIDVTIPYGKITVITGVSGSGKSSLAFDTLYAESRQRFFASMSSADRSHFSMLEKPSFDKITGLPPAIAISQQNINRNPRSTTGTATDLYPLLRTLYANIGIRHCPECGRPVIKMTIDEIREALIKCEGGTRLEIKPFGTSDFSRTGGEDRIIVPENGGGAENVFLHSLDVILRDALAEGRGAVQVRLDEKEVLTFQTTEKCYYCDHILFEMTASDFSFNNPESMCPVCSGLGQIMDIDPALIIRNPDLSLLDGASPFWGSLRKFMKAPNANWMRGEVLALALEENVNLEAAWKELPESFRLQAIYGSKGREVSYTYHNKNGRTGTITRPAEGAYHILKRLLHSADAENQKSIAESYGVSRPCNCCGGERLKPESRLVTIADTRFPETVSMSMEELYDWITQLPRFLSDTQAALAQPLLQEMSDKLADYRQAGLGYLTLDRPVPTLSGGEWQRLQLVTQLNSGLSNLLYILDEPTAGLHPRDYTMLTNLLKKMKDQHNTVVVVEHSPAIMLAADKLIDIGPGAGCNGGRLTAQGTPEEILQNPESETGLYLSGKKTLLPKHPTGIPAGEHTSWIRINGIRGNNLQNISVSFPLNVMTCITGVSGSGKSSLVSCGIIPAVQDAATGIRRPDRTYETVSGAEEIKRMIHITQKPIGRSSRSTPATYTGLADDIRSLFASTRDARSRGYAPGRFSSVSRDGQCPVCKGYGYKTLEAAFLPEAKAECPLCRGKKFNTETLQILYHGKNISEVMDMSVKEALLFFRDYKKLADMLQLLQDIGLGYLTLGQSSGTLSGGEAQRIKLAAHLCSRNAGQTLYLLDEPTAGLHFSDIKNLLRIFAKMLENGSTILLAEHNPDVIRNAGWIIDLGPEGGNRGGRLVIQGTPAEVADCPESYTGQFLR